MNTLVKGSTLVTGTFEAETQAARAVRKLLNACVPSHRVRTIVPRGRQRPAASRTDISAGSRGGILVAVRASDHVSQYLALKVLRDHGARDIENMNAERRATLRRRRARQSLPPIQYPLSL